jgi:chloramphenicol-sensitive protein RarD
VITATPLLWFTEAARRLRLATLGFLQYLAPTGQFLLAVLAYGEQFTQAHMIVFGCIWAALIIYSVDTVRGAQALPAVEPE